MFCVFEAVSFKRAGLSAPSPNHRNTAKFPERFRNKFSSCQPELWKTKNAPCPQHCKTVHVYTSHCSKTSNPVKWLFSDNRYLVQLSGLLFRVFEHRLCIYFPLRSNIFAGQEPNFNFEENMKITSLGNKQTDTTDVRASVEGESPVGKTGARNTKTENQQTQCTTLQF